MSGETFVVRTVDDVWVMSCCADVHPMYDQPYEEFATKAAAERAATAHRAECKQEREERDNRWARCCPTCGRPR